MKANPLLERMSPAQRVGARMLTIGLWLLTLVLGLLTIFALRELVIWGAAILFSGVDSLSKSQAAGLINIANYCSVAILGIMVLGAVIVSGEYVGKHIGERRLLRLLTIMIAVECAIILPVGFFFWWR